MWFWEEKRAETRRRWSRSRLRTNERKKKNRRRGQKKYFEIKSDAPVLQLDDVFRKLIGTAHSETRRRRRRDGVPRLRVLVVEEREKENRIELHVFFRCVQILRHLCLDLATLAACRWGIALTWFCSQDSTIFRRIISAQEARSKMPILPGGGRSICSRLPPAWQQTSVGESTAMAILLAGEEESPRLGVSPRRSRCCDDQRQSLSTWTAS